MSVDRSLVRTWIEVDEKALRHNCLLFRGLVPESCLLMAVAKSNAYGHGLYDYAPAVERLGVDWFGVDSIVEAITLREMKIRKPILVLGYTLPGRLPEAVRHDVSLTASGFEALEAMTASSLTEQIRIHLKIDTGLHRQGFLPGQVPRLIRILKSCDAAVEVEGIYTHFAAAKDPHGRDFTIRQIALFHRAVEAFREAGFNPIRHAGATGAVFNYPEAHYDLVRVGIGLFGLWPSSETKAAWENRLRMVPALSWKTIVSEVKSLPQGSPIGYDLTETLGRDSRVGVCPIGYWHGFPRSLSRKAEVLVRGRRARVLGSVTMDMIVIDLTDVPGAQAGDVVAVIGRDGEDEVSAYELAARAGVSHYELLTRLNPLIQKYYL